MERFGIISYNKYGNFTNYGSALQTWALSRVVNRLGTGRYRSLVIDYCPKSHLKCDILNPLALMWDQDKQSQNECRLSLPAIQQNNDKFNSFFQRELEWTGTKYNYSNFNQIIKNENLAGFICGSDTIFCIDETKGFDDGFYANFPVMRASYAIAYAASFGDAHFDDTSLKLLKDRMQNFKAVGVRETFLLPFLRTHSHIPVQQTLDPTLLLDAEDYEPITAPRQLEDKYVLLYARRYDKQMFEYAEQVAKDTNCRLVDISLRASNVARGHIMRYDAGVEEFLSLVKHAEYVVTNSFHGLLFSIQFRRPYKVYKREQADSKIEEILQLADLNAARKTSLEFLEQSLNQYYTI